MLSCEHRVLPAFAGQGSGSPVKFVKTPLQGFAGAMFGSTGFTGFASWEMGVPCRLLLETRHAGRTLLGSPLPKASLGALKPLNRRYFKSMLELTQRRKSSVAALPSSTAL